MNKTDRSSLGRATLAFAVVTLAGCAAPTVLNTQWTNPQFTAKPIRSFLVVAAVSDSANRRSFGDAMVAQLSSRGLKAAPSYRYAPQDGVIDQAQLQQAVKESGASAVLLSRVVSMSQAVKVTPGMYMGPAAGYGR